MSIHGGELLRELVAALDGSGCRGASHRWRRGSFQGSVSFGSLGDWVRSRAWMTSLFVTPQSRNWSSSDAESEFEALEDKMDSVLTLKPTTLFLWAGVCLQVGLEPEWEPETEWEPGMGLEPLRRDLCV